MIKEKPPRKAKSLSDKPSVEIDYTPINDKKLNWAMGIWVALIALAGWGLIYWLLNLNADDLVAKVQPKQFDVELPLMEPTYEKQQG